MKTSNKILILIGAGIIGYFLTKKDDIIKCHSCDWKWARKDGGDDMYVCHKCGADNTSEYEKK